MSDEQQTIPSAHSLILNRLHQMQQAPYYATAREELSLAESTIVQQEQQIATLQRELDAASALMANEFDNPLVVAANRLRYAAEAERDALKHDIERHVAICAEQANEIATRQSWQESIQAEVGEPPYLAEHRIPAMTHGKYFDYVNLEYANHFKHAAEHLAAKLVKANKELQWFYDESRADDIALAVVEAEAYPALTLKEYVQLQCSTQPKTGERPA